MSRHNGYRAILGPSRGSLSAFFERSSEPVFFARLSTFMNINLAHNRQPLPCKRHKRTTKALGPHMTTASLLNEVSRDEHLTSVIIAIQPCKHVPKKNLSNAVSAGNETVTSVHMR